MHDFAFLRHMCHTCTREACAGASVRGIVIICVIVFMAVLDAVSAGRGQNTWIAQVLRALLAAMAGKADGVMGGRAVAG